MGHYASGRRQPFVALNTAFLEDGAVVSIAAGCRAVQPIYLVFVSTATNQPVVSHPRTLILLGAGSEAKIVESYLGLDGGYFCNAVTELVGGPDSIIEHYRLQQESDTGFHVSALEANLERGCHLTAHAVSLSGALVRNNVRVTLNGEGSACVLNGLYLANGKQHIDNFTEIEHLKPRASSLELYKGRWRVLAQQLERDLRDDLRRRSWRCDRARARHGRPVVEADLDARSCARGGPACARPRAELAGEPAQPALELERVGDVAVERRLARLGDRERGRSVDRRSAVELRAAAQVGPVVRPPKCSASTPSSAPASAPSVVMPRRSSRSTVFGPMPGSEPGRRSAKRAHASSRLSTTKPAGFSASEATFATSLFGPMPTEAVRPVAALISATIRRIAARGAIRPLEVEVGLVEADDLDALDLARTIVHDLRARPPGRP